MRMRKYEQELLNVQKMLEGFREKGIVDTKRLNLMDNIIKWSKEDQFKVLNDASLTLDEQRSIFGAIRNVNVAMRSVNYHPLKGVACNCPNSFGCDALGRHI